MRFTLLTRGRAASLVLAASVLVTAGRDDEPEHRSTTSPIDDWFKPSSATSTIASPTQTPEYEPYPDESPTAGSDTPPVPGQDATAARYAVMREIDPCALHSLEAAAKITGTVPDKIMPGTNLSICDLDMAEQGDDMSTWTLTTTVGVEIAEDPQQSTPEAIGGLQVVKQRDLLDGYCTYAVIPGNSGDGDDGNIDGNIDGDDEPAAGDAPVLGIELQVRHNGLDATSKTPCGIATAYLAEVARYWKEPATRADGVTSPRLRTGDLDPCADSDALVEDLGGGELRVVYVDPFSCRIASRNPDAKGPGLTVKIGVDADPRTLVGTAGAEYAAITVAGRPGVAHTRNITGTANCEVSVVADDQALQPDQTRDEAEHWFQVVRVDAGTCDLASKAASAALAKLR